MSRRSRILSEDERVLWNQVARSAQPLKGKRPVEALVETPPLSETGPKPAPQLQAVPTVSPQPAKRQHVGHVLDEPTRDKLAKGRTPIEGRVDLHGLTQSEAHSLLHSFLLSAHARGVRYVLVITGKGNSSGGDGVLRRMVPAWLSTPTFRPLVSSHDHAARHHGGGGALYVRLRRVRA